MSVPQFSEFIASKLDDEVGDVFQKNKISGSIFLLMSEAQISALVPAISDVITLKQLQAAYKTKLSHQHKSFSTPTSSNQQQV